MVQKVKGGLAIVELARLCAHCDRPSANIALPVLSDLVKIINFI